MGHTVTIGGDRLGSGKKMQQHLHGYGRSNHNLSYVWRSTMAAGTLVPFMAEPALVGDTFDINLNVDCLTHPTIGPLFGSYKIQLDIFKVPIRLYQGKLHMNMLGIGMNMSKVALPQVELTGNRLTAFELADTGISIDNAQINTSCIFSYLNIRGIGSTAEDNVSLNKRQFNATTWLSYWDIYKQYYANKQEEIGAVIHKPAEPITVTIDTTQVYTPSLGQAGPIPVTIDVRNDTHITIETTGLHDNFDVGEILVTITGYDEDGSTGVFSISELFSAFEILTTQNLIQCTAPTQTILNKNITFDAIAISDTAPGEIDGAPQIVTFPLENIDKMRMALLKHVDTDAPYVIDKDEPIGAPYTLPLEVYQTGTITEPFYTSLRFNQEGLALKTYNSDLFNNWIQTEWISGENGIAELTKIDTTDGLLLDVLNMSQKLYNMLSRIAVSDGTYRAWIEAVYQKPKSNQAENPIYMGGLIRDLQFQEVISNSASEGQPLGTLAGRGRTGNKKIGGHVVIRIEDEPCYIMGIVSLTPNIDYSQGNKWDTNLKTLDDFHKPALDAIGYQDLITDQMAYWDTSMLSGVPTFKSAGKQPAWVNYMTNVNVVRGNFADQAQQMFMVLNRRYDVKYASGGKIASIKDLTTYIDPTKFNHIFADTRRDAQNFWMQIGVDIHARRLMSAKQIPNL